MPDWIRAFAMAGILCLPLAHGVCQSVGPNLWGSEGTALAGEWRFTPGVRNGIAIPMPCTIELVWGAKELTSDSERQLHDVMASR